ncbi:WD40-repeat-containing domain protein, partial [Amylocystis lapponica]
MPFAHSSMPRLNRLNRIAHTLRLGTDAPGQSVDAACLLPSPDGDLIVLGHARDAQQVSLLQLATGSAKLHAVAAPERPRARDKRSGVSALCALPHAHAFATGGYDHQVHLWRLGTAPLALAVPHSAAVHALLAPRARAQLLLSAGADCSVHVWDLAAGRVAGTLRASNAVHHLHEADAGAGAVLLEVAHRELQFEVRDVRAGGTRAVLRFGYETARMPGRYARGDVRCHAFASGDKEGRVRLWDLRRPTEAFQVVPCFPGRRLTQVVFDGSQLVACSEDHELAFMALGGER